MHLPVAFPVQVGEPAVDAGRRFQPPERHELLPARWTMPTPAHAAVGTDFDSGQISLRRFEPAAPRKEVEEVEEYGGGRGVSGETGLPFAVRVARPHAHHVTRRDAHRPLSPRNGPSADESSSRTGLP